MSAPPMYRSALRDHARRRELLRSAGRNALPGLMCALVYIYKCAAQKTAESGTSIRRRRGKSSDVAAKLCRLRDQKVPTSRKSADGDSALAVLSR
jgi:hypothetical protein